MEIKVEVDTINLLLSKDEAFIMLVLKICLVLNSLFKILFILNISMQHPYMIGLENKLLI
jgi:hypothetical protein